MITPHQKDVIDPASVLDFLVNIEFVRDRDLLFMLEEEGATASVNVDFIDRFPEYARLSRHGLIEMYELTTPSVHHSFKQLNYRVTAKGKLVIAAFETIHNATRGIGW